MTKGRFCFTVFLLISFSLPLTATAQTVNIPDANLRAIIEDKLLKPASAITTADMETLDQLFARNANISDLTGLEHAINLTILHLGVEAGIPNNSNSISDISPLAGLNNLTDLSLESNEISDLSPLARLNNLVILELWDNLISDISPLVNLTNLERLNLNNNSISDISPLANLTNLTGLFLIANSISDISPLAGLTNLTGLFLIANSISDISPLVNLTNLTGLLLDSNSIMDISPLVANTGLGNRDTVSVRANPLDFQSINTHIPALRSRGVRVRFDAAVTEGVNIPDANLRTAIATALGKASGDTITMGDIETLTELQASNANISDLTGLEHATNLTILHLGAEVGTTNNSNSISDISPLAELNNLTLLDLDNNSISDISPLAELNNLEGLFLVGNSISDISPLTGLTNLEWLWLDTNSISDISPLAGLTKLVDLRLGNNSIMDISPLVANTGLGNRDTVSISANPLNSQSINTHIPTLRSRGVRVRFDAAVTEEVNIPDANLRTAIATALGKASGDTITMGDIETLTELQASNANISDLTGLEHATNLTILHLGAEVGATNNSNSVQDIAPLAGLTKLTQLALERNEISDLSPLATLNNLVILELWDNLISDISPLAGLTNLTTLNLSNNSISAISPLANLTNLTKLYLSSNSISNILPVANLTNLERLFLIRTSISDISPLAGLTNLEWLALHFNSISDISPLAGLKNLERLLLDANSISDISPLSGLTNLITLDLDNNSVSDISPLSGLTNLTTLDLDNNSISDISPLVANTGLGNGDSVSVRANPLNSLSISVHIPALQSRGVELRFDPVLIEGVNIPDPNLRTAIATALGKASGDTITMGDIETLTELQASNANISYLIGLEAATNLAVLNLGSNSISDISLIAELTNLTQPFLQDNSISDISPLVANMGLGREDTVNVSANPLSYVSINTHIPALQRREVEVHFENLKPTTSEYTLSIPAGISLIHVPLRVTEVNGREQTIELISDLYNALGGVSAVNFLITYDSQTQEWRSFFVPSDKGGPADSGLSDDTGLIIGLSTYVSVHLRGTVLGTNGNSSITLNQGLNVVGLPLNDSRITRVSDLFTLDGIGSNVPVIILTDGGEFKLVGRADDPGDIEITGGQAFIMSASRAATATISGDAWADGSGTAAAPPVTLKGIEVRDTTPVLGMKGAIVDAGTSVKSPNFRVTVKNLSTDKKLATSTADDERGYRLTGVDIKTGRAATVGDILEISAQSPNSFIGVEPLRYTVTTENVKRSLVQLPNLLAYEIPKETELLANYPNPFNPETWIPYRLAEDAFVTLIIYDQTGQVVRTIDVGHKVAAGYEDQAKAIYWDGRNAYGESVASGVYFYHLSAGDYSATRRMVILK